MRCPKVPPSRQKYPMKRFDQKVKDIVEVRSAEGVRDFLAEPADTLARYHFTDITSDLMAKWVDRVASVKKDSGAALALAGFRGVGKSHFTAALGAIIARPDLRATISDPHVAATAQQLSRRHGVVAHVRRGSRGHLIDELKEAIAAATATKSGDMGDSIGDLLAASAAKAGELPPVILIDTAFGRDARVARDDGPILSDIAAEAVEAGIFLGVALDDDIAGADGINSSIASAFEIDYLDQEHLYKIVNTHVFAKSDKTLPVLNDIYESYRLSMPGFRWSESRFTSLYPLHPAILEISPFVRLYLHDFALLGFASKAGVKILGRPANSLIGLDEVFDDTEDRLRHVEELSGLFEVYDTLDRAVVAKAPVMQRLQAKLVLKGLFLLSLRGEGIGAAELAGSMLIFDEKEPALATANVEAVLRAFASAAPDAVKIVDTAAGEPRFLLRRPGEADLDAALEMAVQAIPDDVAWSILRRQACEKYADLAAAGEVSEVPCEVTWRGGIRRGNVSWLNTAGVAESQTDWHVVVRAADAKPAATGHELVLGAVGTEDAEMLRRFHVLQSDTGLREKYRDAVATVLHVHSIAVEKIWQRIFLHESRFIADGVEYKLPEQAASAHSLAELMGFALGQHFEARYASHPELAGVLDGNAVSQLVEHLFSGTGAERSDVQALAAAFALPLGLVREDEGVLSPVDGSGLMELPVCAAALGQVKPGAGGVLSIADLLPRMQAPPYGLSREACHLVLAALVGQRQFEFVTASGIRINHRSLDLQIIWDDIVGLAQPAEERYSPERLFHWAVQLTGERALKPLKNAEARQAAREALSQWLASWQTAAMLERFDKLPDEKINTAVWRVVTSVKRSFGAAAEAVDALLNETGSLEACLQAVADAFIDSDEEFNARQRDLALVRDLVLDASEHARTKEYLLFCEPTGDPELDAMHVRLLDAVATPFRLPASADATFEDDWQSFRAKYCEAYAARHDAVMSTAAGELEIFLSSDEWTAFGLLAERGVVDEPLAAQVKAAVRAIRSMRCSEKNIRELLARQPHCNCTFSLSTAADSDAMLEELRSAVRSAVAELGDTVGAGDTFPAMSALEMQKLAPPVV